MLKCSHAGECLQASRKTLMVAKLLADRKTLDKPVPGLAQLSQIQEHLREADQSECDPPAFAKLAPLFERKDVPSARARVVTLRVCHQSHAVEHLRHGHGVTGAGRR